MFPFHIRKLHEQYGKYLLHDPSSAKCWVARRRNSADQPVGAPHRRSGLLKSNVFIAVHEGVRPRRESQRISSHTLPALRSRDLVPRSQVLDPDFCDTVVVRHRVAEGTEFDFERGGLVLLDIFQ